MTDKNVDTGRFLCLNEALLDVVDFNEKAGNSLDNTTFSDLFNQSKLVVEEAQELMVAAGCYTSLKDGSITLDQVHEVTGDDRYDAEVEILDAICDLFVVSLQALAQIEELGFNTEKAFNTIMENNNKKIFTDKGEANKKAKELGDSLGEDMSVAGVGFDGEVYYTIRDKNNKIRKPLGFEGVDIKEFVPED